MARPHVPQFGKWEGEQDVPYTIVFDKARQGRGGKLTDPYASYENPAPSAPGSLRPQTQQNEPPRAAPTHERRPSREVLDRRIEEHNRRSSRTSIGSERSIDRSPLHNNFQPKVTGRGNASPLFEPKGSTSSHGTPARSRLNAREDHLDKGATVPAFGQWDEANPAAAPFTAIFDKVREEKHTGSPMITTETHDYSRPNNISVPKKAKSHCCIL